jgi:hypothetical protein
MYYMMPKASPQQVLPQPFGGLGTSPGDSPWWVPIAVVGLLGLVGFGIYTQYKVASRIAEKEGSEGLLKYEAGQALIGLGSRAGQRMMENKRGKRRRSRSRR